MNELKPVKMIQALALFDEKTAGDCGLALWAAFHEVEEFYKRAGARIDYQRYFIAPVMPAAPFLWNIAHLVGRFIPGGQLQRAMDVLSSDQTRPLKLDDQLAWGTRGRTYDQSQLALAVRNLIGPVGSDYHLMIVTDRLITPPPKWRYIIWETLEMVNASVISATPLDPDYWRDKDPDRVLTVKKRARAAVLNITGGLIGLKHCDNPACFLFDDVDSVTVLDEMKCIGPEHNLNALDGYGFNDRQKDPTIIEPPALQPVAKRVL
ncbi:hypothetical protein [Bradyrhizobium guangzhouense]|uniref:hypothetical protein n=1 Tax=Bradyrhizobium guangzhouense TaxID=1325095 RepID=UPI0013E8BA00|nr:hypothetical protein [Bradyrhizobium guangzhouense]